MIKKVCVLGMGYIGLPTAAIVAKAQYEVLGVDKNESLVAKLKDGRVHIDEPELEIYVTEAIRDAKLNFSVNPSPADVFMICVPTPLLKGDVPSPDISMVVEAFDTILPLLKPGNVVILESTSPVGTTDKLQSRLETDPGAPVDVHFAYCPERVLPGNIINELLSNPRLIGGAKGSDVNLVANFYRSFVQGEVVETDSLTSEMAKLVENSYRDVNIAFANEVSMLAKSMEIDIDDLLRLVNLHPRVNVLTPGIGVGGHCIAVDPWFLAAIDIDRSKLVQTARQVNEDKTSWVVTAIESAMREIGGDNEIFCLGISYKADCADVRESPALKIVHALSLSGKKVRVIDPLVDVTEVAIAESSFITLKQASKRPGIFIGLVNHSYFRTPEAKELMTSKVFLDFCGIHY